MVDTPEMYENGFHLYFKERIKHFSNCSLHLSHYQQILRCRDSTIPTPLPEESMPCPGYSIYDSDGFP